MSQRLQVLVDEAELRRIRQLARRNNMTVAEWVRKTLREASQREPSIESDKKLKVIRAAAEHSFPVSDIDIMLGEIERGYLSGSSES
jgi:hypothetical protein